MVNVLRNLVGVRSRRVEEVQLYLAKLIERLERNPQILKRFGVSLATFRVPLQGSKTAFPDSIVANSEDKIRAFFSSNWRSDTNYFAPTGSELFALDSIEANRILLLGMPGSGKSEWLKNRVARHARTAHAELLSQRTEVGSLSLPMYFRVSEVMKYLTAGDGKLAKFLYDAGCLSHKHKVLSCAERFAAGLLRILSEEYALSAACLRLFWSKIYDRFESTLPEPRRATHSRVLICLDNWPTAPSAEENLLKECVQAFAEENSSRLIITARLNDKHVPVYIHGFEQWHIAPLSKPQVITVVQAYFGADQRRARQLLNKIEEHDSLSRLSQSPLLLTFLCRYTSRINVATADELDQLCRADLYRTVLLELLGQGHLGGWDKDSADIMQASRIEAKLCLAGAIAARFFPREVFSQTELFSFLWEHLASVPAHHPLSRADADQNVIEELCRDAILRKLTHHDGGEYRFTHFVFQEYLTAFDLARQHNDATTLTELRKIDRLAWLPEWQEVIILLCSQLNNPLPLLELLSNVKAYPLNFTFSFKLGLGILPANDDLFRHKLCLAAPCLFESARHGNISQEDFDRLAAGISGQITAVYTFLLTRGIVTFNLLAAVRHFGLVTLENMLARFQNHSALLSLTVNAACFWGHGLANNRDVIEHLLRLVESAHITTTDRHVSGIQCSAATALKDCGTSLTKHPQILPRLVSVIESHPLKHVRKLAAQILGNLPELMAASPHVLSKLWTLFNEAENDIKIALVKPLRQTPESADQYRSFLHSLVALAKEQSNDLKLRNAAIEGLGALGAAASNPLPIIYELLALSHENAINIGAKFELRDLCAVVDEAAVSQLIDDHVCLLLSPEEDKRREGIFGLQQMGPSMAKPVVIKELMRALEAEHDPDIRIDIIQTCFEIYSDEQEINSILQFLVHHFNRDDIGEYEKSCIVLGFLQWGEKATQNYEVVKLLEHVIETSVNDYQESLRVIAAGALVLTNYPVSKSVAINIVSDKLRDSKYEFLATFLLSDLNRLPTRLLDQLVTDMLEQRADSEVTLHQLGKLGSGLNLYPIALPILIKLFLKYPLDDGRSLRALYLLLQMDSSAYLSETGRRIIARWQLNWFWRSPWLLFTSMMGGFHSTLRTLMAEVFPTSFALQLFMTHGVRFFPTPVLWIYGLKFAWSAKSVKELASPQLSGKRRTE